MLNLRFQDIEVKRVEDLRPLLAVCHNPGLASLQELHLSCHCQAMRPATARLVFAMMMQRFAARAPHLRVLTGHCWQLASGRAFPIMANLRHLILTVTIRERGLPHHLIAALPLMSQLETLHLVRVFGLPEAPALDLTPCTKLQSVRLGGIAPAELALGSTCQLNLDLVTLDLACEPVWATLSSVHTLHLDQSLDFIVCPEEWIMNLEEVPLLCGCVHLDTVYLTSLKRRQELPPGITGARKLVIRGGYVDLRIPAATKWEVLEVQASGSLALHFEDMAAFARSPPAFLFQCREIEGPWFWGLMETLGNSCCVKDWQGKVAGLHICNICTRKYKEQGLVDAQYGSSQNFTCKRAECCCGACRWCLVAAGKMTEVSNWPNARLS